MKKEHSPEHSIPLHDRSVHAFLYKIMNEYKSIALLISVALYVSILLIFGDFLKISCNYFVVLPLMAFSFVFGLPGGLVSGILALPANLLIFKFQGHMEYAPDNLVIAESTGIIMGAVLGFLSEYFTGMLEEIDQRIHTEARLRSILKEKDTLLSEVNHRVRNNLNIITSLIQLHSNNVDDPVFKMECSKLKDRVYSISLVHEQLFLENQPLFLDVSKYIESLLENLILSLNRQDLKVQGKWTDGPVSLGSDRVLYLGLILHEVVMNSVKYGCVPGKDSIISVSMEKEEDGSFSLKIEDNGPGFNPEKVEKGLGLRLIDTLCSQFGGYSSWDKGTGSTFRLNFRCEAPVPGNSENKISR